MLTYQTAKLLVNNEHVISQEAFDNALNWLTHFNHAGRVAFTLPKTIAECEIGLTITQDDDNERNVL